MNLILSRKGLDSRSGGMFSPYDHLSGKYIWFPIPEKVPFYNNKIRYSDIQIKSNYFTNLEGKNLSELYFTIKGNNRIKLRKNEYSSINDNKLFAHFDPMLGIPPWMDNSNLEIGTGFGQANAASNLEKKGVENGSIFLFLVDLNQSIIVLQDIICLDG